MEQIKFFTGLIVTSADPRRLADFYAKTLNLPLEETQHGGTQTHFECDLGEVHFAIHPIYQGQPKPLNTSVKLGFVVFDIKAAKLALEQKGITVYGPMQADYGSVIGFVDPDGNGINIYQHSFQHYERIEKQRSDFDLLAEWKRSVVGVGQ